MEQQNPGKNNPRDEAIHRLQDKDRLQRLQNNAARLVFAVGRRVKAKPLIHKLHWLPVEQRILFKVLLCEFNGQKCGSENFTTTITNYGVCFTFNSITNEDKLSVNTAGARQGLSVILNAEENNVVAAPRENLGFKVLVHPRDEIANLLDYGIELQPGTHTPIRLDVTEMKTLGSPYGKCGNQPLKYLGGAYTESKCYLECETDYIVSKCGCRNFYMPGNATYCSPSQLTKCFYNESREYYY
ncbi:acid-sensing ion channel 3-like [Amphiura filiformis]|uniref:acid-sensing ion channel 3-like n=1 Tax=Amphiura filiformis TaxID=82378 RepID=UPI003B221887